MPLAVGIHFMEWCQMQLLRMEQTNKKVPTETEIQAGKDVIISFAIKRKLIQMKWDIYALLVSRKTAIEVTQNITWAYHLLQFELVSWKYLWSISILNGSFEMNAFGSPLFIEILKLFVLVYSCFLLSLFVLLKNYISFIHVYD